MTDYEQAMVAALERMATAWETMAAPSTFEPSPLEIAREANEAEILEQDHIVRKKRLAQEELELIQQEKSMAHTEGLRRQELFRFLQEGLITVDDIHPDDLVHVLRAQQKRDQVIADRQARSEERRARLEQET